MWWFQPLARDSGDYAQRYPQKLGRAVCGEQMPGCSNFWVVEYGTEWPYFFEDFLRTTGREMAVSNGRSDYSISSSLIATVLIWAQTRCPGFIPRFTSDFLVMLAMRGAPISNNTSTDD